MASASFPSGLKDDTSNSEVDESGSQSGNDYKALNIDRLLGEVEGEGSEGEGKERGSEEEDGPEGDEKEEDKPENMETDRVNVDMMLPRTTLTDLFLAALNACITENVETIIKASSQHEEQGYRHDVSGQKPSDVKRWKLKLTQFCWLNLKTYVENITGLQIQL